MPDNGKSRRTVLKGLTAVPVTALAGCIGGEDDDDGGTNGTDDGTGDGTGDGMGERVPQIALGWTEGIGGFSRIMESAAPLITEDLEELGLDVEIDSAPLADHIGGIIDDVRTWQINLASSNSSPDRSDPQEWLHRFTIQSAGPGDGLNFAQYADCDYSALVFEQDSLAGDARREKVHEALIYASEDYVAAPITGDTQFQVYNNNRIDPGGIGTAGIATMNPHSLIESEPTQDDTIRINFTPTALERANWALVPNTDSMYLWNHFINAPLLQLDENYNLQENLASSYTVNEDATEIVVELKDTTLHNGDPLTSEDVKFTFEMFNNNSADVYRYSEIPFESIELIDDRTIEFNMSRPWPTFITRDLIAYGIHTEESWGGAMDDLASFSPDTENHVGTGPFQLDGFQAAESISLSPHDGHPTQNPDHRIVLRAFREETTAVAAFESEELDMLGWLSPSGYDNLRDHDWVTANVSNGFVPGPGMIAAMSQSPGKFRSFRQAIGTAINRQRVLDIVMFGEGSPQVHGSFFTTEHPWHPDEGYAIYVDDTTGDIEMAREVLAEAGWTWDDDGNLHYPEGVDTGPAWPEGEHPSPDDFPCVDADGNYIGD